MRADDLFILGVVVLFACSVVGVLAWLEEKYLRKGRE